MGPGMGSKTVHQRCTRGEARASSVVFQGLQRGFPLLTPMLWVLAWFDHSPVPPGRLRAAGIGGAGGCSGHKSPLKAGSWVVAGDDAVLGGSSRRVFYSHRAAEGCPPKVSPADGFARERHAGLAVVTASALPGEETD